MPIDRPQIDFKSLHIVCEQAIQRRDYGKAFRLCEALIKHSPYASKAKKIKAELSKNPQAVAAINSYVQRTEPNVHIQQQHIALAQAADYNALEKSVSLLSKQYPHSLFLSQMGALAASKVGLIKQAKAYFSQSLHLDPLNAENLKNFGLFLRDNYFLSDARDQLYFACQLQSRDAELLFALASLENDLKSHHAAEPLFQQAVNFEPENVDYILAHFACLVALKKISSARKLITKIRQHKTYSWKAELCEAYLARKTGNSEQALGILNGLLQDQPNQSEILLDIANILKEQREFRPAIGALEKALEIDPESKEMRWNLAFLYLMTGDFEKGWKNYEMRWQSKGWNGRYLETVKPVWTGTEKGRLLIWKEQGIGDEIMFLSLLHQIPNIITTIMVECDQRLQPLLSHQAYSRFDFITDIEAIDEDSYDYHLPLGSLPYALNFNPDFSQPMMPSYLQASPQRIAYFQVGDKHPQPKTIGLSWKSTGSLFGDDKNVHLADMIDGLAEDDIRLVNLQYGNISADYDRLNQQQKTQINLVSELDKRDDLDGLAALMMNCDAIVTTSNATVHLASALGLECHLILHQNHDWKWHENLSHSYWYPKCCIYRFQDVTELEEIFTEIKTRIFNYETE